MGNGYNGYSMSNNAVKAYEEGAKPLSRWNKSAFIDETENELDIKIKKVKGSYKRFLSYDSWHHTSKFYNVTEFYGIDFDSIERAIKNGEIVLFTDEEIKELESLEKAESIARAERIAAAEKRLEVEEAAERKEAEQAKKELRISKKGNEILTIFITPKEKRLYRKLKAGKYIGVKDLTENIKPYGAIKELKIKEKEI